MQCRVAQDTGTERLFKTAICHHTMSAKVWRPIMEARSPKNAFLLQTQLYRSPPCSGKNAFRWGFSATFRAPLGHRLHAKSCVEAILGHLGFCSKTQHASGCVFEWYCEKLKGFPPMMCRCHSDDIPMTFR